MMRKIPIAKRRRILNYQEIGDDLLLFTSLLRPVRIHIRSWVRVGKKSNKVGSSIQRVAAF